MPRGQGSTRRALRAPARRPRAGATRRPAEPTGAPQVDTGLPAQSLVIEAIRHAESVAGADDLAFVRELRKKFFASMPASPNGDLPLLRAGGRFGDASRHIYDDARRRNLGTPFEFIP